MLLLPYENGQLKTHLHNETLSTCIANIMAMYDLELALRTIKEAVSSKVSIHVSNTFISGL